MTKPAYSIGGDNSSSPEVVNNFHNKSDKDSSTQAQHHTLGAQRNQASPGDHIHDGKNCRRLGEGQNLALTGKVTPTTVAELDVLIDSLVALLSNFVAFTDSRT